MCEECGGQQEQGSKVPHTVLRHCNNGDSFSIARSSHRLAVIWESPYLLRRRVAPGFVLQAPEALKNAVHTDEGGKNGQESMCSQQGARF